MFSHHTDIVARYILYVYQIVQQIKFFRNFLRRYRPNDARPSSVQMFMLRVIAIGITRQFAFL